MDKKNKITLGMLKGKPIMSSVPSISIRFDATAEEIDDLFDSDTERGEIGNITTTISDTEASPAKQQNNSKITKRSTSIDVSNPIDASPPSDPWRFFSDIKGKITKSVEGKLTEYKSRSVAGGEGSPKNSKPPKEAKEKEGSSLSDSEELSESSISRTCGIVSTTEGAEMSSDDETPSLSEKEKKDEPKDEASVALAVKKKFKVVKNEETKTEGLMSGGFLENLRNINMGLRAEEDGPDDVESGVDALSQLENVEIVGDDVVITQTSGTEIRDSLFNAKDYKERTVLAPTGYVDLRPPEKKPTTIQLLYSFRYYILTAIGFLLYILIPVSQYTAGFMAGNFITLMAAVVYVQAVVNTVPQQQQQRPDVPILEIPPVRECQPQTKYEGWVNEYPEEYDPYTYHVSDTQPVYLRLQGNLLKISHTASKIPKRAMWNEGKHKMSFTKHRIYNLLGAQINLLPLGLTKIRHWSKKYPISIKLDEKHHFNFDYPEKKKNERKVDKCQAGGQEEEGENGSPLRKWKKVDECQVFSKLSDEKSEGGNKEEVENSLNPQKDISSGGGDKSESEIEQSQDIPAGDNTSCQESCTEDVETNNSEFEDLFHFQINERTDVTTIYIFTRTDREKEHWYKRLTAATHPTTETNSSSPHSSEEEEPAAAIEKSSDQTLHEEYLKFMSKFSLSSICDNNSSSSPPSPSSETIDTLWLNALVTRVAFDLIRDPSFVCKMKERIQRKLSAIKLPYFIEELTLSELFLGNTPPTIKNVGKPVVDDWGLWIDLHLNYEGRVMIILQTKLNLMKLKQPPISIDKKSNEKSPIFHSDVDDTAESSSDDEGPAPLPSNNIQGPLDSTGHPVPGLGGTGSTNKGKRLIKMVDRIAESKLFQAATENKYIKKAIEGVSNTELGLKVELKSLDGLLVLNIPTPPSDRVWVGFRPTPNLVMNALPIVGERNINFLKVTGWIERKLYKEFQKLLVIPNMEDLHIPVMMQMLPK